MKKFFIIGFLALTACVAMPAPKPAEPKVDTGAVIPTTEGDTQDEKLVLLQTGTGGLAEALLPTGFLAIGNAEAPVTLLLWTHPSCRYCREFLDRQLPRLTDDFLRPGTVRLQVGFLPLRKYPQSQATIGSLICAAVEGKGMPMLEALFEGRAENVVIEKISFKDCLTSSRTQELLSLQASLAHALDVTLVPTFFLNGRKLTGLPDYPDLRGAIQEALDEQ